MAGPTTIQVKRTSTAGRTPNTTDVANSQYINAGELALNMTDQILYTSNGSTLITIGANVPNQAVTNIISVGNSTVNVNINATSFSGTANNSLYLGGVVAASYMNTSGNYIITGIHTHNANLNVNTFFWVQDGSSSNNANSILKVSGYGGRYFSVVPSVSRGSYNTINANGDIFLLFSNGTIGSGNLNIGPWGGGSGTKSGIQISAISNVTTIYLYTSNGVVITSNVNNTAYFAPNGYFGVGIGMITPNYTVDVNGSVHATSNVYANGGLVLPPAASLFDSSGSSGSNGLYLSSNGSSVQWSSPATTTSPFLLMGA